MEANNLVDFNFDVQCHPEGERGGGGRRQFGIIAPAAPAAAAEALGAIRTLYYLK
jgi:hypothetical protein